MKHTYRLMLIAVLCMLYVGIVSAQEEVTNEFSCPVSVIGVDKVEVKPVLCYWVSNPTKVVVGYTIPPKDNTTNITEKVMGVALQDGDKYVMSDFYESSTSPISVQLFEHEGVLLADSTWGEYKFQTVQNNITTSLKASIDPVTNKYSGDMFPVDFINHNWGCPIFSKDSSNQPGCLWLTNHSVYVNASEGNNEYFGAVIDIEGVDQNIFTLGSHSGPVGIAFKSNFKILMFSSVNQLYWYSPEGLITPI